MRKKLLFEFPDSEMIEVKLETGILIVSGEMSPDGWKQGSTNWWEDEDES